MIVSESFKETADGPCNRARNVIANAAPCNGRDPPPQKSFTSAETAAAS